METENKETENQEGTTTTTTPAISDNSRSKMEQRTGGLDYINNAAKTGQEGAEAIKKVEVPRYTPITYKMLKNDPEVREATPSLIRNAIFKGLEGALSTKSSGRQFDPTTRMGQYDDAEMQRYTENATDKENTIYQAQKQPIENAVSAQAQAGIQTEDAALNSYIQDYTAEKDQDRKFALLKQVMGQAGLTKGVDENGNPIYKDWTELKTEDLLKLNQLMQYLSGDTSVMNLLVGQYGPEVIKKVEGLIDWIKGGGNGPLPSTKDTTTTSLTPGYPSLADWKVAYDNGDVEAKVYKANRLIDLGGDRYYDISDTSDEALNNLAMTLAQDAVNNNDNKLIPRVLDEIERKTKAETGGGWFNKNGKEARRTVEVLIDDELAKIRKQQQGDFVEGSDTSGLNISDYGDIENQLKQLIKDGSGTSTNVDIDALKKSIEDSTLSDEVKEDYLNQLETAKKNIELNYQEKEAKKREEEQKKDIKARVKKIDKDLKKIEGMTSTNYAKKGTYSEALVEAQKIYQALQSTGEPLPVIKETEAGKRLYEIAKLALDGGRFAEEDKSGLLANYIKKLGTPSEWGGQ